MKKTIVINIDLDVLSQHFDWEPACEYSRDEQSQIFSELDGNVLVVGRTSVLYLSRKSR